MEPQIVDHYNELPQSVYVIDKMNEEYEEAMAKIKQLEEEREKREIERKEREETRKEDEEVIKAMEKGFEIIY